MHVFQNWKSNVKLYLQLLHVQELKIYHNQEVECLTFSLLTVAMVSLTYNPTNHFSFLPKFQFYNCKCWIISLLLVLPCTAQTVTHNNLSTYWDTYSVSAYIKVIWIFIWELHHRSLYWVSTKNLSENVFKRSM